MKTQVIHQPHDKLIKQSLTDIRVARDFFAHHLPKELLNKLDLSELKMMKQTFIDEQYKSTEADILYQVRFDNDSAYLYVLCEHTSKPDKWLPLRQLQYRLRVLEHIRQQNPKSPLPLVYSMIIYTGEKPYPYSTNFFDLFEVDSETARTYWELSTRLVDVHRQDETAIEKHRWFGIVELAFKCRAINNPEKFFAYLNHYLNKLFLETKDSFVQNIFTYLLEVLDTDIEMFQKIAENKFSEKLKGQTVTLSEQFRQQGREQGRQEGHLEGLEAGIQKGQKSIAKKLVAEGFSRDKVVELTGVSLEELQEV